MKNITKEITKKVNINELENFLNNPRHQKAKNQNEVFTYLFSKSNATKMYNLAKNICEMGMMSTHLPLVYFDKKNDKYKVYDGNRRIASIKAILNPELLKNFKIEKIYNSFSELNKIYGDKIVQNIDVVVTEDEEYAIKQMEIIHSGEGNGVGQTKWGAEEKDRFKKNFRSISTLALNIKDHLDRDNFSIENKFEYTDLTRIFKVGAMKKFIGEKGDDYKILSKSQIKLIETIINEMSIEAKKTSSAISRCFSSQNDTINFINKKNSYSIDYDDNTIKDPTIIKVKNDDQSVEVANPKNSENTKILRMPKNIKKTTLIDIDWALDYIDKMSSNFLDIECILRLLTTLPFSEDKRSTNITPITILLRCLIEYSTYGYWKVHWKKDESSISETQKKNLFNFVNQAKNNILLENPNIKDLFKTFPKENDFQVIQGSIHKPVLQCSKDNLIAIFNNMKPYLEICLKKLLK